MNIADEIIIKIANNDLTVKELERIIDFCTNLQLRKG